MKFLKNWTIELTKIPVYSAFKGPFNVQLDYAILQDIMNVNDPEFTNDRKILLKKLIDGITVTVNGKTQIVKGIDKRSGLLEVSHSQRYGLGRFYPNHTLSPICMSRHIKHTLFQYLNWIDIDMVKGHPSILFSLAKNNNLSLPTFEKYLNNPDDIFSMLVEYYSPEDYELSHDNVKDIFNILIYGGGHTTWLSQMEESNIEIKTTTPHQFVNLFKADCKKLIDLININNPELVERVKGDLTNDYEIKTRVMSYFCGIIENEILHISYKFLIKEKLIKERECALEYDGLCFKSPIDTDVNPDDVLANLNFKIKNETKLNVKMKIKSYNPKYVHQTIIDNRNLLVNAESVNVLNVEGSEVFTDIPLKDVKSYDEFKFVFEKSHCKIINRSIFLLIIKTENGEFKEYKFLSESKLVTSYKHLTYQVIVKGILMTKSCIQTWLTDMELLSYDDIGCYPPPLNCPSNIFNSWTPFRIENLKVDIIPDDIDVKITHIEDYILNLCSFDKDTYDYLIRWVAQMLMYPAIKTIVPTIISKQGSGKGNFIELLRKLMGSSKVLETPTPDRDVWGSFNSVMVNAFLVNCDELSKKQQENADGIIKSLITNTVVTINQKGVDAFQIASYHRFLMTTNKEFCINTSDDDRRNFIIRGNDTRCKKNEENKLYHTNFVKYINDDTVVRVFYEKLCKLENLSSFNTETIPRTEYHLEFIKSSRSIYEQFLEYFTEQNIKEEAVFISSSDYYKRFVYWSDKNGITYDTNSIKIMRNTLLLKKELPELSIVEARTTESRGHTFNILKLKEHFKLIT
jgi:hypothetical protein